MAFVRSDNPIWIFRDHDGQPLDDQYYVFFLENTIPYIPQNVYQDADGELIWPNPLQLDARGALPNNLYFDPTKIYRLEIRKGNLQSDELIDLIENYDPEGSGDAPVSGQVLASDNLISNPQFVDYILPDFQRVETGVTNTVVEIAPGWEFVGIGTGNYKIKRTEATSATEIPTNAPYYIEVETSGSWSNVYLRQRFNENGTIWAEIAVSTSVTAQSDSLSQISARLVNSIGQEVEILEDTILTTTFNEFLGVADIPTSTNTDAPDVAYTEYRLVLPITGFVRLTSFQVSAQDSVSFAVPFEQETVDRQRDHLFHYYQPLLADKPIPSLLVGWDFPLNPTQFGASHTLNGSANYIWDQLIMNRSAGSNFTIFRGSLRGDLNIQSTGTNSAFYMLQYLDGKEAKKIIYHDLSVNVEAFSSQFGGSANIDVRVYLFRGGAAAPIAILPASLGTVAPNGTFSLSQAGWTEIPRQGTTAPAKGSLSTIDSKPDLKFSGWRISDPAQLTDTNKFAIVVTFAVPGTNTIVDVRSISLTPGLIPTRPAPQSEQEVLSECQYYFEKSYAPDTLVGTSTPVNQRFSLLTAIEELPSNNHLYLNSFYVSYSTKRVSNGLLTFWTPTGVVNEVQVGLSQNGSYQPPAFGVNPAPLPVAGNWAIEGQGPNGVMMRCLNTFSSVLTIPLAFRGEGILNYHFELDARLGHV